MSYEDYDISDYYLGDGVYWDWDRANPQEDYELDPPVEDKELADMLKEVEFAQILNSWEAARLHHFFEILCSNIPNIAERYCQYEGLAKDYAEVAMQRDVLKDIAFVHASKLEINFAFHHITRLNELVLTIYDNANRRNVYDRVGTLQRFFHECALETGKRVEDLDREIMRRFLSLSRLHIAISDARKKNLDIIKDELTQNYWAEKYTSVPPYVKLLNRQYIKNWKKRHLRSLLHFCPEAARVALKDLLNLTQPFDIEALEKIHNSKYAND